MYTRSFNDKKNLVSCTQNFFCKHCRTKKIYTIIINLKHVKLTHSINLSTNSHFFMFQVGEVMDSLLLWLVVILLDVNYLGVTWSLINTK